MKSIGLILVLAGLAFTSLLALTHRQGSAQGIETPTPTNTPYVLELPTRPPIPSVTPMPYPLPQPSITPTATPMPYPLPPDKQSAPHIIHLPLIIR